MSELKKREETNTGKVIFCVIRNYYGFGGGGGRKWGGGRERIENLG